MVLTSDHVVCYSAELKRYKTQIERLRPRLYVL